MKAYTHNQLTCEICNNTYKSLGSHLKYSHNITNFKEYYDQYIKEENEGFCPTCGKETVFLGLTKGYRSHCCTKCSTLDKDVQQKYINTNLEKYGVINAFCIKDVQEKAQKNSHTKEALAKQHKGYVKTCLEKYGVDNSSKCNNIRKKISNSLQNRPEETKQEWKNKLSKCSKLAYKNNKNQTTNLKKYGVKHVMQNIEIKQKFINTCTKKYGGIGSQSSIIKNKIEQTNLQKYGVKSPFQVKKFQEKVKRTMLERYGVENPWQKPINKEKARKAYTGHVNKFEKQIYEYCKSIYDGPILQNCRSAMKHFELDFYFPDLRLGVEFNGNYWHSYPRKPIDYHTTKSKYCRKNNIRLIQIYEFEDLEQQLVLLKDLINGHDNYHINDFNKNNLIARARKPKKYITEKGEVYTAGPLYNSKFNSTLL